MIKMLRAKVDLMQDEGNIDGDKVYSKKKLYKGDTDDAEVKAAFDSISLTLKRLPLRCRRRVLDAIKIFLPGDYRCNYRKR